MDKNQLYYGDNLTVLREHIKDESVDLIYIYLDPPFNSRQDYNVLFAERDGTRSASQIMAFEDTWEWNMDAERAYEEIVERGGRVADAMRAFRTFLGHSDMMAYLAMMAPRLIELHRVLKVTGSTYLHCDPTASHYLKMLMDAVFGPQYFRSEIIWKRNYSHNSARRYGPVHDTLLFYSKTDVYRWNKLRVPLADSYVASHYKYEENGRKYKRENITGAGIRHGKTGLPWRGINPTDKGRHWIRTIDELEFLDREGKVYWPNSKGAWPYLKVFHDESSGQPVQDIWTDLTPINSQAQERLGYPTQKPETLLERMIRASSNEADVILDPFCGCGTAIAVAQRVDRRWIGIDITHLAIGLIKKRLDDAFGESVRDTYEIIGEPVDLAGAQKLAQDDPYQFQWWALSLVGARPLEKKKGADQGIDGRLYFHDERNPPKPKSGLDGAPTTKQIILSVKAGHVQASHVRDLRGVIEREKAQIGALLCMEPPTKPMMKEAAEAGFYQSPGLTDKYPRIQILSIAELLMGKRLDFPRFALDQTFRKAPKAKSAAAAKVPLPFEVTGDPDEPF